MITKIIVTINCEIPIIVEELINPNLSTKIPQNVPLKKSIYFIAFF